MIDGNPDALRVRTCCPCCESTAYRVIAREPYGGAGLKRLLDEHYGGRANHAAIAKFDYELVRCTSCGLGYQRTVPASDLLNEIYEQWIVPAGEKDRLYRSRELSYYRYLAEQLQFVIQHLKRKPSTVRALDFGMGWAEWATMAKAFGCQISGMELSADRVTNAQSIGIEVVQWEDLATRKFDFINTEQVFEHLIDPLPTLRHLANALDGSGLIRVSVPDARASMRALAKRRDFAALSSQQVMSIAPLEHVNCFDYRSLVALGKFAGLRPVRPGLRHLYNSSSGWFELRNALRLILRPIYRHIFPKSTVVYFCRQ